jgi:hypothetical protein
MPCHYFQREVPPDSGAPGGGVGCMWHPGWHSWWPVHSGNEQVRTWLMHHSQGGNWASKQLNERCVCMTRCRLNVRLRKALFHSLLAAEIGFFDVTKASIYRKPIIEMIRSKRSAADAGLAPMPAANSCLMAHYLCFSAPWPADRRDHQPPVN